MRLNPEILEACYRAGAFPMADRYGRVQFYRSDPRSILELDYGSVADLFTWDELDNDHSAGEIQEAISALSGGNLARSIEVYQGVAARWAEVRSHESLN